jgi:putative component of toxin-antitoxin plasmid stabilization module
MIEIRKTEIFAKWIDGLNDIRARARVLARIERLATGNPGDVAPVGEGVSELRIDYGPGYPGLLQAVWRISGHTAGWRRQTDPDQRHQDGPAAGEKSIGVNHDKDQDNKI